MAISLRLYLVATLLCIGVSEANAKDYPASLFNIYSDGVTLNTRSIQFAIDYINKQGGGRLVFDVGRYLTGSVHLKSGVTIHLMEGAVLSGALNPFDYDRDGFTALILARDQQNIGITGKGMIDGQGRQVARNVAALVHEGLIRDAFRNDRPEVEIRPMLVYFRSCTNVLLKGITFHNAAAWVQTYDQCRNLIADSITIDSRAFWNNDGMDIVDCEGVVVSNSYIDAADDGICLKSHDPAKVCQDVVIRNCTIRSSANAIKFGTASLGGFRHIRIINNRVFNTYRSALALEAVDGGFIDDVVADSMVIQYTGNVVFLRIGERVTGKKGRLENVHISNITAEIASAKPDSGYAYEGPIEDMPRNISPAIIIAGLPGVPVKNIWFSHIAITHPGGGNPMFAKVSPEEAGSIPETPGAYPEFSMFKELPSWAIYIRHAEGITFSDVVFDAGKKDYRIPVVLDDLHHAVFTSVSVKAGSRKNIIYQSQSSDIVEQ